jgi:hypothetical protein
MKRAICILIPILFFGFTISDQLKGRFYNHTISDKIEYFDFKSNGQFEYYAECEYKRYGKGKYQIQNNNLILEYLIYDSNIKGHFDIWGYKIASQYSDTIHLRIQDSKNDNLLDSVVVHYKDSQNANLTNTNGKTKVNRYDKDLIISRIGYRDLILPKDKILNKAILGFNVFLQDWSIEFLENICDTISIKTIHRDTLMLDKCIFVKNIKPKKIMICE